MSRWFTNGRRFVFTSLQQMPTPLPKREVRRHYRAGPRRLACTEEPRLSSPRPIKETRLQTGLADLLR
jgi:hypothetical protein